MAGLAAGRLNADLDPGSAVVLRLAPESSRD